MLKGFQVLTERTRAFSPFETFAWAATTGCCTEMQMYFFSSQREKQQQAFKIIIIKSKPTPPPKKKQKTRPITMLRHTQGQKLAVTSHNSSQLETNTVWIWAVSNTSDHKMKSSWRASAFLQCLKTFRQHVILNCQAWELKRSWLMKDPQLQRCPVSKRKPKFS